MNTNRIASNIGAAIGLVATSAASAPLECNSCAPAPQPEAYAPTEGRVVVSSLDEVDGFMYLEMQWEDAASLAWFSAFEDFEYTSIEPDFVFDPNQPYLDGSIVATGEPLIVGDVELPCSYVDTTAFDGLSHEVILTIGSACASRLVPKARYYSMALANRANSDVAVGVV